MFKNIVAALISLLFALILCEFILQFVDVEQASTPEAPKENWALVPERVWTEYHERLGWYHQKNKEAVMNVSGRDIRVKTNEAGFRADRDYSPIKPEDVSARIMVLGDSFAFGFGVEQDQTFSALLEKNLDSTEVLNIGVPGYGADQILMAYREFAPIFQPDTVIVALFPEDFWRSTKAFADSGHAKPYFVLKGGDSLELRNVPVPPQFELKTEQFPNVIEPGRIQSFFLKSRLYRLLKHSIRRLGKNTGLLDPDMTDEWLLGKRIYKQLMDEIASDNRKGVAVLVPPHNWVAAEDRSSLHKSIRRFSSWNRFNFLDLTDGLKSVVSESDLTDYYIEHDWHWTALGHEYVADVLADYLNAGENS